ncbi:MAG: GntR family transcriptional regulator [Burkholderiaceae bacterium]|nr:GntR family transcriptional regulator [Burkholderiaceae bacterium]
MSKTDSAPARKRPTTKRNPPSPAAGAVMSLHRSSPVAMHRQLSQHLRDAITNGVYKQGDRIATEQELSLKYGVSRITARQAVIQLVSENLLVRRQGKGTFVTARPVKHDLVELHGFFDELVARGVNPEIQLLEFSKQAAPARVAEKLQSDNKQVTYWKRLYCRNGEPFAVAWVYLAPQLLGVTRALAEKHTSYHIIESLHQLKIAHADVSIRAQLSEAKTRKLLRMPPGTPLIALERVSYLADNTPIEYALYCAHADSYEYTFRVSSKINAAGALTRRSADHSELFA